MAMNGAAVLFRSRVAASCAFPQWDGRRARSLAGEVRHARQRVRFTEAPARRLAMGALATLS